jgi:hypothetical protein
VEVFEEAVVIELSSLELGDGDYRVLLLDGGPTGAVLGATTFRLRSSSAPLVLTLRSRLSYATGEPLGALSARDDDDGVRGALVTGTLRHDDGGGEDTSRLAPRSRALTRRPTTTSRRRQRVVSSAARSRSAS